LANTSNRDELAVAYLEQLPFEPYPVQEEALLEWFGSDDGVLVCAPTGTGKTLIAEAAVYEALHTGKRVYYTTPLIALTEQKLQELQASAERWGFSGDQIGLVTGNRRVNPDAPILVVVAEILLNRLLHPAAFDFADVDAVVMDEFHSFNDAERGIVWEFTLSLLPPHVRLLLLSATVGNSREFVNWLSSSQQRRLALVEGHERKVPLTYQWVGDALLNEHVESMAAGGEFTPALIFCFNRELCWTVAEQLKGKSLLADGQQKRIAEELKQYDLSQGVGPKLKPLLLRGVGVHHAGVMPRYRRIVETLYQRRLLSIAVCTETLSAGINLPARSVVLPTLLKGPPGDKKVLEPSSAHQMFGRAGRPQYDTQGFVFSLAHEDDVKIARWRVRFDQIPENTKDPQLLKAKKALKKKMPKRRATEQYWEESHFQKLCSAEAGKLASRGPVPWRLLAYMLDASPEVSRLHELVDDRLLTGRRKDDAHRELDLMLMTLWRAGYVELDPPPPKQSEEQKAPAEPKPTGLNIAISTDGPTVPKETDAPPPYRAATATPTERLERLLLLRGINPLYGLFLMNHLGAADRVERIQAMESVLELPRSLGKAIWVPRYDDVPQGPLARDRLNPHLLQLGLATAEELGAADPKEDDEDDRPGAWDERVHVLTLAEKLRLLFQHDFPGVSLRVWPVWAAGEVLEFGGEFNKYITSKGLQKQEGLIFRHLLRFVLLLHEFMQFCPPDLEPREWESELMEMAETLSESCRSADPDSTDKALQSSQQRLDV
jgi:superfamily II DNA/RNA helicase